MEKKYISIFKKICAIITSVCFTFTIICDNLFAAVNIDALQSQKQYFEIKDANNLDYLLSSKYGKIISFNNNFSDIVLINIQDLHCDYAVQKNISYLIKEISEQYNIDDVYVEGGIGNIDTSFLANINSEFRQNILENLLKSGNLTGTEYYSIISGKTNLLKGVEEKDIYLNNIVRLKKIIESKDEISAYLSKIDNEIEILKAKHLKSQNKNFDELLKKIENQKISQEKFIFELFSYARKNNISLKNYKNLQVYLSLFNNSVSSKKVQKEIAELLNNIKQSLPYDKYNELINLTSNFSDIQKLGLFVKQFCDKNNIDLSKVYPNLNEYLILKEKSLKCNPIELVKEERTLIDVIRTNLSQTQTELEITYLSDFEQFYKGYLSAKLTSTQWEYVKLGLEKFKELYAKYSISNDVEKLEKYSDLLTKFYDVNTERNRIFVQKMGLLKKSTTSSKHTNSTVFDLLSSAKKIVILVAGGYHTEGINEILNKNGVTNITITPNITNSTQDSRLKYEYLAQQQSMSFNQMIALELMSNKKLENQMLTIASLLLPNQNLDGVNINILVQQLNRMFSQSVVVSLTEDGRSLKFAFKNGEEHFLDIDKDIANLIQKQKIQQIQAKTLTKVSDKKLEKILTKVSGMVSKASLNFEKAVVAPQIYQISKDLCVFIVKHKVYLGNGAVWEIANSEYSGKALDGVEPVVYEYMPGFMQRLLLKKQQFLDKVKKKLNIKSFVKKIVSLILILSLTVSLTACSVHKKEEVYYRYSPQIIYTLPDPAYYGYSDILEKLRDFSAGNGLFNSFNFDSMSPENKSMLTKQEINIVSNQRNLYDQALVALMFIQEAQIAKENGDEERMYLMLSSAEEILYAIDSQDVLYKSNLEQHIVIGEILWVGIAATQYKLVTNGSEIFDGLIAKVDKHINMFYRNKGFIYGRADENWVSTEHMLDAIVYYNLKLYCDKKYGNSVDFNVQNRLQSLCSYLYKELYDKTNSAFYRGRYDKYYVLDTCSWGVQMLLMVEYLNPELFNYGLNNELYLQNIDIYSLLDYAEEHFCKTITYNGNTYSNLYVAADEPNNPVMFEWTVQMAISYALAANKCEIDGDIPRANIYREKAERIMADVRDYARDLGFYYPPYIDQNGQKIYVKDGWLGYAAESVAVLAQIQQYQYGSFYFPMDDTEKCIEEETEEPSSILPGTIKSLNNLISNGIFSIKKALSIIINKETIKSLINPLDFIRSHSKALGAKILVAVTSLMLFLSFGILLSQAIPLVLTIIGSILSAVVSNIGTHIIIDYRYLKSIGLNEALALYGKDNVRLTETGLAINNQEQIVPVYVINDKPRNVKDFNFNSVPIKVKTQSGKFVKCWIGNYNGASVLFAEGANYETIVQEFSKTKQFETVYGGKTVLKANVDIIEIDMNNPNARLSYSDSGNIIIGANVVKTEKLIDPKKERALIKNKDIEAVTINQNIAIYIDDGIDTISASQEFINLINSYVKNDSLGTNTKILFSNKDIDSILKLLEQELGSEELALQKFIEIIRSLKKDNKEVVVIFDEVSKDTNFDKYKKYGISSYVANNEYVDGITLTKSKTRFVTNLNQISCFDGSLSIIKVSLFRKEIEQRSGIFTFLSSSLNLKEYIKKRSIKFIKQVASNFDYSQLPKIDIDIIANVLKSENKYNSLKEYLSETDPITIYYLGLYTDEERSAFIDTILERILVANYLREYDKDDSCLGLQDKKMETILAAALVAKYNKDNNFNISSEIVLDGNVSAAQFELNFEEMIMNKVSMVFKNDLSEIKNSQSLAIDDIIRLIVLYAERKGRLNTAKVEIMDIQNIKGILSAA